MCGYQDLKRPLRLRACLRSTYGSYNICGHIPPPSTHLRGRIHRAERLPQVGGRLEVLQRASQGYTAATSRCRPLRVFIKDDLVDLSGAAIGKVWTST